MRNATPRRFSKQMLIDRLEEKIVALERTHGFDRSNGTAQLKGRNVHVWAAYGEFNALVTLQEEIAE